MLDNLDKDAEKVPADADLQQQSPDQPGKPETEMPLLDELAIQQVKMGSKQLKKTHKFHFFSGFHFNRDKFVEQIIKGQKNATGEEIRWLNEEQLNKLKKNNCIDKDIIKQGIAFARSDETQETLAGLLDTQTKEACAKDLPKMLHEKLLKNDLTGAEKRKLDKEVNSFLATITVIESQKHLREYVKSWNPIPADSPLLKRICSLTSDVICVVFVELYAKEQTDRESFAWAFFYLISEAIELKAQEHAKKEAQSGNFLTAVGIKNVEADFSRLICEKVAKLLEIHRQEGAEGITEAFKEALLKAYEQAMQLPDFEDYSGIFESILAGFQLN